MTVSVTFTSTCQSCAYCSENIINNLAGVPKGLGAFCTLHSDIEPVALSDHALSTQCCPYYMWHRPDLILRGKNGGWRD